MVLLETQEGDRDIRAGIIVHTHTHLLGCLPSPTVKWMNLERRLDLPKGHLRQGETPIQGAIRECREETGLSFEESDLTSAGNYTVYGAPLFLFTAYVENVDTAKLHCVSKFKKGITLSSENTGYKMVPFYKIRKSFLVDLVQPILLALGY